MALSTVSVILLEPVPVFEFGAAVEVFGLDRSADGVPALDLRVCAVNPGVPLRTANVAPFTISAAHGLDGQGPLKERLSPPQIALGENCTPQCVETVRQIQRSRCPFFLDGQCSFMRAHGGVGIASRVSDRP